MTNINDCFMGEKVTKDVSKKINIPAGMMLHLSHASLDHLSDGKPPVSLVVKNGQEEYLICTLRDCGHTPLDLNFSSSITLKVKGGPSAIHVTGYWEVMGDPDMDMEELEEFEEDEDEEATPAPAAAKASPKEAAKEAPKETVKASPKEVAKPSPKLAAKEAAKEAPKADEDAEELGDDESITSSVLREMLGAMEEMEEFEEEEEEEEEPVKAAPAVGQKRPAAAIQSQPPQKKAKGAAQPAQPPAQPPAQKPAQKPQQQQQQQQQGGKKKGKKN